MTLNNRVNKVFRMLSRSKLLTSADEDEPVLDLYDEETDVSDNKTKINLCRLAVSTVLQHLDMDQDEANKKVSETKVSALMDVMDLFVSIAKGKKKGENLLEMTDYISDLTKDDIRVGLAQQSCLENAILFIEEIIHEDSVENEAARRMSAQSEVKRKKSTNKRRNENTLKEKNIIDDEEDLEGELGGDIIQANNSQVREKKVSRKYRKTHKVSSEKAPTIDNPRFLTDAEVNKYEKMKNTGFHNRVRSHENSHSDDNTEEFKSLEGDEEKTQEIDNENFF
eukprot:CAMPEP_0170516546 /NCGR_PEP_ID=MMETSP0209-20121228/2727_1 /TAXON_ID=665100 ORGANISM="Litonotus pictus, Strain P1" /NCGR_SAMPLE_ID=MMETSP0209 /ASSEMBLY_ACC=CAM_ASM_000301 /LENGTH=280 /DNA_ID=CAMNT_0010801463 /DNA_START=62 /DNA_END=904 /DNA_ORIENTATION=-